MIIKSFYTFFKTRLNILNMIKSLLELLLNTINLISRRIHHNRVMEFMWTILPSISLILIGIPSLYFLNSTDSLLESEDFTITVQVCGNQWFWSYASEYMKHSIQFDSYMIPEEDLTFDQLRLIESDACLILPGHLPLKFLVTSSDVLHCWAIPSLGIKIDACPGRLNQILSFVLRPGIFYGQCSEICGINHGFMPICVGVI